MNLKLIKEKSTVSCVVIWDWLGWHSVGWSCVFDWYGDLHVELDWSINLRSPVLWHNWWGSQLLADFRVAECQWKSDCWGVVATVASSEAWFDLKEILALDKLSFNTWKHHACKFHLLVCVHFTLLSLSIDFKLVFLLNFVQF